MKHGDEPTRDVHGDYEDFLKHFGKNYIDNIAKTFKEASSQESVEEHKNGSKNL